ncbi:hypothetical protein [Rhizobium leguminosarum]|uniref:hypothetical protein n=1 Tax=Rhizobium leguminosarum TaxID=384 RepID=UPI003F9AB44B
MTSVSPKPPEQPTWSRRDTFALSVALVVTLVPVALGLAGCYVLLMQVIVWLQTGIWQPQSVFSGFARFGIDATTSMVGLNTITQWLPLSGTLIIAALVLYSAAMNIIRG